MSATRSTRRFCLLAFGLGALLCSLSLFTTTARAQAAKKYDELPIGADYDTPQKQGQQRLLKNKLIRSGGGSGDQLQNFYYLYFFPSLTHVSNLGKLSSNRDTLKKFDFWYSRNNQALHNKLLGWTLTALVKADPKSLLRGNYHPATKYNAMLIIGDLNASEGEVSRGVPPIPLPEALTILVQEYENPDQTDPVKLAALIGMKRHAGLMGARMPPATRNKIMQMMLQLANASDPPEGRTAEAHTWFRRRAVDVLAAFRDPGVGGSIATAMTAIVGDSNAPLKLRTSAARALGKLNYQANTSINPTDAARALGSLAAAACRDELARIDDVKRKELEKELASKNLNSMQFGGGGGGGEDDYGDEEMEEEEEEGEGDDYGGGSYISSASVEQARKVLNTRRRLKEFLYSVRIGLVGDGRKIGLRLSSESGKSGVTHGIAKMATDDPHKSFVQSIMSAIDAVDTTLSVRDDVIIEAALDIDALTLELRPTIASLEAISAAGQEPIGLPGDDVIDAEMPENATTSLDAPE